MSLRTVSLQKKICLHLSDFMKLIMTYDFRKLVALDLFRQLCFTRRQTPNHVI